MYLAFETQSPYCKQIPNHSDQETFMVNLKNRKALLTSNAWQCTWAF